MRNLILGMMLLTVLACGKEDVSGITRECPTGDWALSDKSASFTFQDTAIGYETKKADGCYYVGSFVCDASTGNIAWQFTIASSQSCPLANASVKATYTIIGSEMSIKFQDNKSYLFTRQP
jgi:hypothetical protein